MGGYLAYYPLVRLIMIPLLYLASSLSSGNELLKLFSQPSRSNLPSLVSICTFVKPGCQYLDKNEHFEHIWQWFKKNIIIIISIIGSFLEGHGIINTTL